MQLVNHYFTLYLHGELVGEPVSVFLRRLVNDAPAAFGEVADLGAKYTFKPDAEGRSAWLQIEPSASIQPNGLYVVLGVSFGADQVEIERAAAFATSYLQRIVTGAGFPAEVC